MLKTRRDGLVWLITQPAHGALAGDMAAHWGNEEFSGPGAFAASQDSQALRREVVLAIAEHDNGWWEWEADPPLSAEDGLPQGLGEVLRDPVAGMDRWRIGIRRLADDHPYAALLISDHAYWLYAAQFRADPPPEFVHQLQLRGTTYPAELNDKAKQFLDEVEQVQRDLCRRLEREPVWRAALEPQLRHPHARLLQTLDAFSLTLCSAAIAPVDGEAKGLGEDHVVLHEVPRTSWEDRVSMALSPAGEARIVVDPYPFNEAPLTLGVPARVAEPRTWWRQAPTTLRQFTFYSR